MQRDAGCWVLGVRGEGLAGALSFRFPGISQEFPKTPASELVSQMVEIRGQMCVNRLRKWP